MLRSMSCNRHHGTLPDFAAYCVHLVAGANEAFQCIAIEVNCLLTSLGVVNPETGIIVAIHYNNYESTQMQYVHYRHTVEQPQKALKR